MAGAIHSRSVEAGTPTKQCYKYNCSIHASQYTLAYITVQPHLEYVTVAQVWDGYLQSDIDRLKEVQNLRLS